MENVSPFILVLIVVWTLCWVGILICFGVYAVKMYSFKQWLSLADDDYCMCGSRVDDHGWGDNHTPVSEYDHALTHRPLIR